MKNKNIFFFVCIINILMTLNSTMLYAQLLHEKKVEFTKADSLRGGHHLFRKAIDVNFYDLNINVKPNKKSIKGKVAMYFTYLEASPKIQIDLAPQFKIEKLELYDALKKELIPIEYEREDSFIFLKTNKKILLNNSYYTVIQYKGKPQEAKNPPWDGGFSWKEDDDKTPWVAVSCQGLGASSWWPLKDDLQDEPDSVRIAVEVPKGLENISNGRLDSIVKEKNSTIYTYFVSYPINTYNVTLNIGHFTHLKDVMRSSNGGILTLDYYIKKENVEKAKIQLKQVIPMIQCFEKAFGPYPFIRDGYKLIETPYLGMEHQSAIAYGNKYQNGYLGRASSKPGQKFDFIIIHESGHEWWGNHLSAGDNADLWLHEAFTTYSEVEYVSCMFGEEDKKAYLRGQRLRLNNDAPIVGIYGLNHEGSVDMYNKGSLILYTFSQLIGEKKWRKFLINIQQKFGMKTMNTNDFLNFVQKEIGEDYEWFFTQYLERAKLPVLKYNIKKKNKKQIITLEWTHCNEDFKMPVLIKVGNKKQWIHAYTMSKEVSINSDEKISFINDIFCYEKQDVSYK